MSEFAAIPTMYNGVQFRSRLEARWAAFFDLCGWQWEYEPFDLNGWIPDFVLSRHSGGKTLVEVKPDSSMLSDFDKTKPFRAEYDILHIGGVPRWMPWCVGSLSLPGDRERSRQYIEWMWSAGETGRHKWNLAGNAVQWRAKRDTNSPVKTPEPSQSIRFRRSDDPQNAVNERLRDVLKCAVVRAGGASELINKHIVGLYDHKGFLTVVAKNAASEAKIRQIYGMFEVFQYAWQFAGNEPGENTELTSVLPFYA